MIYYVLVATHVAMFTWLFWALYVFTMGIYRLKLSNQLRGVNYFFALPIVALAVITDVVANLTLAVIVFADIPREWLVTERLQRYLHTDSGWRSDLALRICTGILDMFDPRGKHC